MKKLESNCVGCTDLGLHCLGDSCPNANVVRYYCDECGCEDKLYHYDGKELCQDCLLEKFEVVKDENDYEDWY